MWKKAIFRQLLPPCGRRQHSSRWRIGIGFIRCAIGELYKLPLFESFKNEPNLGRGLSGFKILIRPTPNAQTRTNYSLPINHVFIVITILASHDREYGKIDNNNSK